MSEVNEIAKDIVDINGEYGFASVKDGEHRYLLDTGRVDENERLRTFVKLLQVNIAAALAAERENQKAVLTHALVALEELHREQMAAERAKFAAFADEKGEPRKVVGNIPVLASGEFVGNHATVWAANAGEVFSLRIDNIGATDDQESDAFFEAGELFSSKEAATSALAAAKEKR